MIRILTASQTKALDAYTIQHEPIASIDLMERASHAFVQWFTEHIDATHKIGVVCGTGNNGGDGLAIARLLKALNYHVEVWVVRGSTGESSDFSINLKRLNEKKIIVHEITNTVDAGTFQSRTVLIDALFGTGLNRPAEGIYVQVINCMNAATLWRIAVDVPSGLQADAPSTGAIVKAHHTVTFQVPKLAFLLSENEPFVGKWTTVNIGLNKQYLKSLETLYGITSQQDCKELLKARTTFQHKGNFGHALLVAGSYGKTGAAILAARAALRTGVGLLTIHAPKSSYAILQTAVPEAMTDVDIHELFTTYCANTELFTTIGIGPGIGTQPDTVNAFSKIVEQFRKPMVLDADALNIISKHIELRKRVPKGSLLTPHPKEFERLVGGWSNSFERLEKQKALAAELNAVVLVKGAYTAIASAEGKIFFNPTGNPGMATAGSGDVLTGILTALVAQGYSALDAARLGTYLHGKAGDIATREKGMASLIATDIIEALPRAFKL